MKNKTDVLIYFKHFHTTTQIQYGAVIKAMRTDNETEYTNKTDVLIYFKHFHTTTQIQYGAVIKAMRTDNGTEYTNKAFKEYL
jgi:hypothetical protein